MLSADASTSPWNRTSPSRPASRHRVAQLRDIDPDERFPHLGHGSPSSGEEGLVPLARPPGSSVADPGRSSPGADIRSYSATALSRLKRSTFSSTHLVSAGGTRAPGSGGVR